jgi:uncharacterized protein YlxP (DUF503 family)
MPMDKIDEELKEKYGHSMSEIDLKDTNLKSNFETVCVLP